MSIESFRQVLASSAGGGVAGAIIGALLGIMAFFVIRFFIASSFYRISCQKGHYEKKYFHFSFWFGLPGYLMVAALPDRTASGNENANRARTSVTNDLPEI